MIGLLAAFAAGGNSGNAFGDVNVSSFSVSDSADVAVRDAFAEFLINNDTTIDTNSGDSGVVQINAGTDWKDESGNASKFEVKATKTFGADPTSGDLLGSWLDLGTSRSWRYTRIQALGVGVTSVTLQIEVREKTNHTNSGSGGGVVSATLTS